MANPTVVKNPTLVIFFFFFTVKQAMPTHNKASHAYARLCLIIVSNILDSEKKNVPWSWMVHLAIPGRTGSQAHLLQGAYSGWTSLFFGASNFWVDPIFFKKLRIFLKFEILDFCIVVSTLERKKHIDPIEKALKGRLCRPFGKAKAI